MRWAARNPEKIKAAARRYYLKHKARKIKAAAEWSRRNPDKRRAISRKFEQKKKKPPRPLKTKEEIAERRRNHNRAHPEIRRRSVKLYRQRHPEMVKQMVMLRRARKLSATIGDPALITAWEKRWRSAKVVKCFWCRDSVKPDKLVPMLKELRDFGTERSEWYPHLKLFRQEKTGEWSPVLERINAAL